jgi:hypothetical protein
MVITVCTFGFNIQEFCIVVIECIYELHMILGINSDYFPKQYKMCVFVMETQGFFSVRYGPNF